MLTTPRLQLIPVSESHFAALEAADLASLATQLKARTVPAWLTQDLVWEVIPMAAQFRRDHPEAADWWLYFFFQPTAQELVGVGGFKGAPTAGSVEVGYSIAPAWRHQGYATEATRGLLNFAFAHSQVDEVLAHTLPQENFSTRVLRSTGFRGPVAVDDPDDGPVWRWALPRAVYRP